MDIVSRAEWGARPPKTPPALTVPSEAWLHHTVGDSSTDLNRDGRTGDEYMRAVQKYHMDGHGWNDIAYNYVVDDEELVVYEGRGGRVRPGAQKGHNRGTVAIAVMGDFRHDPVTGELVDLLADLMVWLHSQGFAPAYVTGGHRDAPGQTTTCPGRLADHIPAINERIDMTYRGVLNVPDADWARNVVDWGIDSGLIVTGDDHPDDWNDDQVTMGRLWTLFHRQR